MHKKSIYFTLILLSLISIGLFILLSKKDKNTSTPSSSTTTLSAETILTFSPNPLLLSSEIGSIDILMDTTTNAISFVQLRLTYNPTHLTEVLVTPGSFLGKGEILTNKIDQKEGTISYIISLPKNTKAVQGKGVIATISFKTSLEKNHVSHIRFTKDTFVTNATFPGSLLKKTTDGKIEQLN